MIGQMVRTTEHQGPRGCDAGQKIKGRKRPIVVVALGMPLDVLVRAAHVQDRDGARRVLTSRTVQIRRRARNLDGSRLSLSQAA